MRKMKILSPDFKLKFSNFMRNKKKKKQYFKQLNVRINKISTLKPQREKKIMSGGNFNILCTVYSL